METSRTSASDRDKNLWEDFRDTVRGGVRDFRNMGDELARQGRLRMDLFQTERRLRGAFEALGEACYTRLSQKQNMADDDPTLLELTGRIRYYSDEIIRLEQEQKRAPEEPR